MKAQRLFFMAIISTVLAFAGPVIAADVNVAVVALLSPSSSDTATTLPISVSSVPKGQDYYIEVWASDVGATNTGLTSVYTDITFTPSGAASVQSIDHGGIFTVFGSGSIISGGIDELGGSSLTAAGIEPQWARAATIRMHADAAGTVSFSLAASSSGIAALGRGLIPWSNIGLGNVTFEQVQCPSITDHPNSQALCEGGSVTFTVSASGTGPLSYQWRKYSSAIPGATSASYTIDPVSLGDAGSYNCVVPNACGSATSNGATLTVNTAPVITNGPGNRAACEGGSATFSVTATGAGPLSYQWRKNGSNIPGATSSSYMINPVAPGNTGSYDCVVTNACGSTTSSAATLSLKTPPVITNDPGNQILCEGNPVTFTVSATGTGPLSYQWRKNGSNISGATSSSHTINPVASAHAGSYDCVVTNACGNATSNTATLTVNTAPVITDDPGNQAICDGGSATFSVSATGTAPLSYQWRKNGSNISGATNSSYTINPVAAVDAGNYDCVVTNGCGSATSDTATLTVNTPPVITDDPGNQTVCEGGIVSFSIAATGAGPLSYQWRKNGSNIPGATSSSYAINPVAPGSTGSYDCVVTNACGSTTSGAGTLTVNTAPLITDNPDSQAICEGSAVMFTVSASGTAPLSYQWRKDGTNIPGATGSSYTINPVAPFNAGRYDCVVTNTCGSATSDAATLTTNTAPVITDYPENQTLCEGGSATFSVTATGTGPLSYQWRKNGSNIPGATGSSYTINPVAGDDTGGYDCVITNTCGIAVSNTVALTVGTAPVITGDPGNQTVCEGDAAILIVSATGTAPLSYQWRKNGSDIAGATNSGYIISPVATGDVGSYACVVTNSCGSATSNTAILTVNTAPVITDGPGSQALCEGGSAAFSVSASGTGPLSYQWRKNGSNIPGATSSSYTINPVAGDDTGGYDCVITNTCGTAISNTVALTVGTAPVITGDPVNQTVCVDDTALFTVSATGTAPLSYQWRRNGSDIAGATNSSYIISPVATGDEGSYACVVTNNCGSATSGAATITVNTAPVITDDPDNQTLCESGSATFSVSASGTAPLSYQWRKNGSNIPGATGSSYGINPITSSDAGNYGCVVTNGCGNAISNTATLTVNTPPAITDDPDNQTVCEGALASFSVVATGAGPLSYQWHKDGSDIAGATNSSYTIDEVGVGDLGNYECVVMNSCGSATSTVAVLTMNTIPVITDEPDSQTADEGGLAMFSVTATGAEPLSYQWRKDGGDIPDATCAVYTIYPVTAADAGNYECVVTNICGSVVSVGAALTVGDAPVITSGPSPSSLTICEGDSKEYCVSATGTGLLSYQWQRDGSDIAGAMASCYVATLAGSYRCIVRDDYGYATSGAATLELNSPPVITQEPRQSPLPACEESSVTFVVEATGAAPLHYQWKIDDVAVGDDAPQLVLDSVRLLDHGAQVICEVSNDCGNVTSAVLSIAVSECAILYVDHDASGENNGASWDDAFNHLQDALDLALASGGAVTEIRVAEGTYRPDLGVYHTIGERIETFQIVNSVAVKGGYAGGGEPDSDDRDIHRYETILSGDIGEEDDHSDNSYHVVTGSETDSTASLDGFVITGGHADVPGHGDGGGMYNNNGSPTITNCVFRNNVADNGAGIANSESSPVFMNCIFSRNIAGAFGGAVYNVNHSDTTVANCTFSRNSAGSLSGGIYSLLSSPRVSNSILWDNSDSGIADEAAQIHIASGSAVVDYSCIQGLTGSLGGTGNIDQDPCFVDAAIDDYHLKSVGWRWNAIMRAWDFDRSATSRCIDAGNPGSSLRGELHPNDIEPSLPEIALNVRRNMGAYGGTAQASVAPPGWALLPDADNSGVIDFSDYAFIGDLWLNADNEQPCDFDRSGDINYKDLSLFVEDWLIQTSWFQP